MKSPGCVVARLAVAAVLGGAARSCAAVSLGRGLAQVRALGGRGPATRAAEAHPAAGHEGNGTVHRARLDVGFSDFESRLVANVSARINASVGGELWTSKLKGACAENVSASLHRSLQQQLGPLKSGIGSTWMALPQEEQKAAFVSTLRTSFSSVLESSMKTIDSHVSTGLQRLQGTPKHSKSSPAPTADQLLATCCEAVSDSLVGEHCYSTGTAAKKEAKRFCIPSVLQSLAHRLNDTQGLISMSMRFEAGALTLTQRLAKAAQKATKPARH